MVVIQQGRKSISQLVTHDMQFPDGMTKVYTIGVFSV